ncbi:MAG: hypothetical protein QM723_27235 [Myxococcaceae bacterium]
MSHDLCIGLASSGSEGMNRSPGGFFVSNVTQRHAHRRGSGLPRAT